MEKIIKVDGYNIATMKAKNWNFYSAGKKITKTQASEGIDLGITCITAKWKEQ